MEAIITSSEAYAADPRVYIPITLVAILVGFQYHRIRKSLSTLLQRLHLKLVVVRRRPSSVVGTVASLHIHPGTRCRLRCRKVCCV
jgi:hypothetical protein